MATQTSENAEALTPTPTEARLAQEAAQRLAKSKGTRGRVVRLCVEHPGKPAESIAIPRAAFQLLLATLNEMGRGNAITLVPLRSELTTQQAADLLNVSRPFLIGLLEDRKIPFRLVGQHRRVRLDDLLAYKRKDDLARRRVADELAAEAQKLGLGY